MPGSRTEPAGEAPVALSVTDYLWFVDLALDEMAKIVEELGDDMANRRPPFRDANSPYAILTHCLGVMEYWGGATVAARAVRRDRAAEFTASGDVAPLLRRTEQARRRLREDMVDLDPAAGPLNVVRDPEAAPVPYTVTKGAVLLHIVEELFQHLGQMEITRDALVSAQRR
jgi:DinB superfamily